MADEEYLKPAKDFLEWFKAWPGTTFHNDIEIVDLRSRGAGRGIIATKDIEADTVLFTIPRKAIISPATSELATLVPSIVKSEEQDGEDAKEEEEDTASNDPWTSLILTMVYEFLRGDQSPWKPYFGVLPEQFDTPMFWSSNELKELQASPVVERVGRAEADDMIKTQVLPVIRQNSSVFFPDGVEPLSDDELLKLGHRMGSTILAYSFSMEKDNDDEEEGDGCACCSHDHGHDQDQDTSMHDADEKEAEKEEENEDEDSDDDDDDDNGERWVEDNDDQIPLGMVPMADMLNADAEFNAHINHGVDALTATAVRPIKAGEEILNYYGPLSNGELLRRYGYTTKHHAHFDAVDLPWKAIQDALVSELGLSEADTARILKKLDVEEFEDPVMLDRDFDEDDETGHLQTPESGRVLAELPPVLRQQARAFVKLALKLLKHNAKEQSNGKKKHKASDPAPKDDKQVVAAGIVSALAARLAQYPTTLAADVDLAEKLDQEDNPLAKTRLRAALQVRIGEKRLLGEALALAKEAAEKEASKPVEETDEQPSKKKQRR